MAQSSWPFENIDTTETQYSQLFRTLNNGVNGTPDGGELEVGPASAGLAVDIAAGQAMVRGHFYSSTEVETRTLAVADSSNDRIDLVVLRLDPIANTIVLAVKTGVPDPAPVAPGLVQTDGGVFEQPLANVLVPANAGVPSTITDRREFMGTKLGTWTTAGRPVPAGRVLFGFNTTLEAVEFYDPINEVWGPVAPEINSLDDIGDVTITTPADGQVLAYDDGDWVNQALTSAQLPSGSIVNVKSVLKTDAFVSGTITKGGNVAVTGLSITHELANASNKLLIIAQFGVAADSSTFSGIGIAVSDGTNLLAIGDASDSRTRVSAGSAAHRINVGSEPGFNGVSRHISFLHSPGSGSKTYTVHAINGRNDSSTLYVNRVVETANNETNARGVSTLTLMEVAG